MTKTAPKSATTFDSGDVAVPERPTTTVQIGSRSYTVRAPKMATWMALGFLLERIDKAAQAQARLDSGDLIAAPERRELEQLIADGPDIQEVHELVIDGRYEGGRLHGGFLRRCLSTEDFERVVVELDDEDSELDVPELYESAFALFQEFEAWGVQRAEAMGLAVPKPKAKAKTAARKATTTRSAAR